MKDAKVRARDDYLEAGKYSERVRKMSRAAHSIIFLWSVL